jgi:hypothetical protein
MAEWVYRKLIQERNFVLILLCFFVAGCYLAPSKSSINAIIYLIGFASFIFFLFNRASFYEILVDNILLVFFLSLTSLSCFWGDIGSFIYALKSSLVLMFFLFLIIQFKEVIFKNIDILLMLLLLSATLWAVILLSTYFSIHGLNLSFEKMEVKYGAVVQSIRTASILTVALLIAVWGVLYKKGRLRFLCGFAFTPLLCAMLLLHSRGTFLAFSIGVSILYVLNNYTSAKRIKSGLIGGAVLLFLVAVGVFFSLEFNPKGIADTVRIPIWIQGIREIYPEKLLWGKGYSKQQTLFVPGMGVQEYAHAHNIFISLLRNTGLLGFGLFVIHLVTVITGSIINNFNSPVIKLLLGWLVAGLCISFFNGRFPVYVAPDIFLTLWLPLALLSSGKGDVDFSERLTN